jgi:hypothetical protein
MVLLRGNGFSQRKVLQFAMNQKILMSFVNLNDFLVSLFNGNIAYLSDNLV